RQEEVLLALVLLLVHAAIEAACVDQRLVRAALHDPALIDHEDLIGSADRREPVGDDERRSALEQVGEGLLNKLIRPVIARPPATSFGKSLGRVLATRAT